MGSGQVFHPTAPVQAAPPMVAAPAAAVPAASKTAPTPQHPGKGVFGEQIEFLGYDTEPSPPRSGQPVRVTYYWHVLKPVVQDWQIFVHVDDRDGHEARINADHFPASGARHTTQWKVGEYIADRFAFDLPATHPKAQLDLWTGYYQGDERLPISDPAECQNDGNNRLLAGTLNLE
jgi:hypothetical protein